VADTKPKKISAKAVMVDLKAGLTDHELMERYKLSFQGLQDLFAKLMGAKLVTKSYLDNRATKLAEIRAEKAKKASCPYCGYESREPFTQCPRCNQDTSEWLDTVELTKMLSFD
jgi:rubrerythrin